MARAWRFAEPQNMAVITLGAIVRRGGPILHVAHDADDGGWQFLGGGDASEEDAMIVALRSVVELDPSVERLADLPEGWHAWRSAPGDPWLRAAK